MKKKKVPRGDIGGRGSSFGAVTRSKIKKISHESSKVGRPLNHIDVSPEAMDERVYVPWLDKFNQRFFPKNGRKVENKLRGMIS